MSVFVKPLEVQPLADYKLWLRFDDGTAGEVDLSDLVGKGVFRLWNDERAFADVTLGPHGEIVWRDEVEIDADALYLEVTGKSPEEIFERLQAESADA